MDWLAGIFELVGLIFVGKKNPIGFLLNIGGNILWLIIAIYIELYGLLLVVIPAIGINVYNWYKWTYENKKLVKNKRRYSSINYMA